MDNTPLKKWSNVHVVQWLRQHEDETLRLLIKTFQKQNITGHGAAMIKLTDDVLKSEFGVS